MKMKIKITLTALALCTACAPSKEDLAQLTFDKAIEAYMARDYAESKLLLDSIIHTYYDVENTTIEATDMLKIVQKTEREYNKRYLDSLLTEKEDEMSQVLDNFYIEDKHADPPVFAHKRQSAYSASERSHIRSYTDINGVFYMSSNYTGEERIYHNGVQVKIGENLIITDTIASGAYRHNFNLNGRTWEIVKYKHGSDNGVASFIANNTRERIEVTFCGTSPSGNNTRYKIIMTDTDKNAIRDTYHLSKLLRDIYEIKQLIKGTEF
jgi:hypothetical protein